MSTEQEQTLVQTLQNTQDIGKLTATIAELATMFKYETERFKEERAGVKDMVTELKGVNEKLNAMATVQKDMAQNAKDITELRARVDQLKEWKDKYDLSKFDSRIATLEKVGQLEEGAARAISSGADWFWRLFGPIVTIVVLGAFYYAFHQPAAYESTFIQHSTHGAITGE